MSAEYLDKLAGFVTETKLEDLEESTVTAAKNVVLDTIGAILAGSRLSENAVSPTWCLEWATAATRPCSGTREQRSQ